MCGLHANNKHNDNSTDAKNFGGGRPLPADSKINPILYLCVNINFIYACLNDSAKILCGVVVPIKRR